MFGLEYYLIGFVIVAIAKMVRRFKGRREVDRNLSEWAEALGLVRVGDELVGQIDGVPVGARLAFDRPGGFDATWTLYARLQPPLDLGLLVHSRPMDVDLPSAGRFVAQTGNAAFDQRYESKGDEPARVRALLGPVTRTILATLHPAAPLLINDDGVAVQGPRIYGTEEWLRQGLGAVAKVALAINEARDLVPAAYPLVGHRMHWARFASHHGLHGISAPLCMWGTLQGSTIYAYANRLDPFSYCLEVFLRFDQPLGLGLLLQPLRTVDRLKDFFGAEDHRLGDELFDDAFLLRVSDAAGVEELLDASLRQRILALHGTVGPFTLTDDGCSFRLPNVPEDPAVVTTVVGHLIEIADRVGDRRFGNRRGPYR